MGCIVDGCPPGIELTEADIQPQLTRRRPGQSALTTPRDEKDLVKIQSGTEFGVSLGTPIGLMVKNEDQRPKDYGKGTMDAFPRPSHAVRICKNLFFHLSRRFELWANSRTD